MRTILYAFVGTLLLPFLGCGDYNIDLPGNYELVRLSGGGEFAVVQREDGVANIILGPKVDLYGVSENAIVGHVSASEISNDSEGYFVISLLSGEIVSGLSENELSSEARRIAITQPELKRPTRFDSIFGSATAHSGTESDKPDND